MTTRYRIGKLLFEPSLRRLVDPDGRELALEPLVFDLLSHFVENADRVVTKTQLADDVWGGRPVSDSVIPHAVSKLRKALSPHVDGDSIVVVHGRGYRFGVVPEPADGDSDTVRRTAVTPRVIIASLAVVALAAITSAFFQVADVDADAPRVAILPVDNQTGEDDLDWARLGLLPVVEAALVEAGADAVSTGNVLATLNRYPNATDPSDQAGRVAANTGAAAVLTARLTRTGQRYVLTVAGLDGRAVPEFQLRGSNLPQLAAAAGRGAVERLGRLSPNPGYKRVLTGDPFIDEAFVRGLDARFRGDPEAAERYFSTVMDADPNFDAAIHQLSLVRRMQGDAAGARALLVDLERRAAERDDARMQAKAWSGLGVLSWREDDLERAEVFYQRALAAYQSLDLAHDAAGQRINLGILAANRGDYDTADAHFRESLALYAASGDHYHHARTLKNLGVLALDRDELAQASDYLQRSLALRRELGLEREVALTLNALADVEAARGNFTEVAALQNQVLDTARTVSDPVLEALALRDLSKALLELGQVRTALERAAESLAVSKTMDNPTLAAAANKQLAHAHRAAGRSSRARELFETAMALHADSGRQAHMLALHIDLARLCLDVGDESGFARHLESARSLAKEVNVASYDVDLLDLQARQLLQAGQRSQAIAAYRHARDRARGAGLRIKAHRLAAELGMALLTDEAADPELGELATAVLNAAVQTREGFAFLAALRAREEDFEQAARFAEQGRRLSGELWTPADERILREYRSESGKG